jgi:hypothetical protein
VIGRGRRKLDAGSERCTAPFLSTELSFSSLTEQVNYLYAALNIKRVSPGGQFGKLASSKLSGAPLTRIGYDASFHANAGSILSP